MQNPKHSYVTPIIPHLITHIFPHTVLGNTVVTITLWTQLDITMCIVSPLILLIFLQCWQIIMWLCAQSYRGTATGLRPLIPRTTKLHTFDCKRHSTEIAKQPCDSLYWLSHDSYINIITLIYSPYIHIVFILFYFLIP